MIKRKGSITLSERILSRLLIYLFTKEGLHPAALSPRKEPRFKIATSQAKHRHSLLHELISDLRMTLALSLRR